MWIRQHLSSRSCKMVKTVKEGFLQETHWPSVPGDQVRGAVIPICCFCRLVPFPILALGKWWALWGNNTPFCDYFQRLIEDTSVFNFQNLIASLRFKIYIYIYLNVFILAVLGLHCCMGFPRVVSSRSCSLVAGRSLLIVVASPVAKPKL